MKPIEIRKPKPNDDIRSLPWVKLSDAYYSKQLDQYPYWWLWRHDLDCPPLQLQRMRLIYDCGLLAGHGDHDELEKTLVCRVDDQQKLEGALNWGIARVWFEKLTSIMTNQPTPQAEAEKDGEG